MRLVDVKEMARLPRGSFPQALVGAGTTLATIAFAPRVERGVLVGIGLAVAVHLYRELLVTTPGERNHNTLTVRPKGVMWFATVPQVERSVREELASERNLTAVVIDLSGVGRLDYSGAVGAAAHPGEDLGVGTWRSASLASLPARRGPCGPNWSSTSRPDPTSRTIGDGVGHSRSWRRDAVVWG